MIGPRLVYVYAASAPVTRGTGHLVPSPTQSPSWLTWGEPARGDSRGGHASFRATNAHNK
jgi:hypothetical protein